MGTPAQVENRAVTGLAHARKIRQHYDDPQAEAASQGEMPPEA